MPDSDLFYRLVFSHHLFDAVYQLLRAEWLRDVIVDFGDMQPQHLIDTLRLGRHHDHRDILGVFVGFHLLVNVPAVHIGHHQV